MCVGVGLEISWEFSSCFMASEFKGSCFVPVVSRFSVQTEGISGVGCSKDVDATGADSVGGGVGDI